jgi:hypothetical protein
MTEENATSSFTFYQVQAARIDKPSEVVFSKIFKLPIETNEWVSDLATYGIAYRDGNLDPSQHKVYKFRWDPNKNIWVGSKLTKN